MVGIQKVDAGCGKHGRIGMDWDSCYARRCQTARLLKAQESGSNFSNASGILTHLYVGWDPGDQTRAFLQAFKLLL